MATKCLGCSQFLLENSSKFSIFERDDEAQKCLVYKIFQITQTDLIYKDTESSFLCSECRFLLVQCKECSKSFNEAAKLRRHGKRHSSIR